jgi:rhodanese-related sulfurtransferase
MAGVPRITKEELKPRLDAGAGSPPVVLDVRLKYPYEHSTIMLPGAIRMAPGAIDRSRLPLDRDIILYDSDPEELVAERAAAGLISLGYRAFALRGGINEWAVAKLPTDSKTAPQLATPTTGASKA